MPCEYESSWERSERYAREMNAVTRWLCTTCQRLLNEGCALPNEPGLAEWWDEHQRRDAQREREEQERARQVALREQALAKLTPEERAVL